MVVTGVALEGLDESEVFPETENDFQTVPDCRLEQGSRQWQLEDGNHVRVTGALPSGYAPTACIVSVSKGQQTAEFALPFRADSSSRQIGRLLGVLHVLAMKTDGETAQVGHTSHLHKCFITANARSALEVLDCRNIVASRL